LLAKARKQSYILALCPKISKFIKLLLTSNILVKDLIKLVRKFFFLWCCATKKCIHTHHTLFLFSLSLSLSLSSLSLYLSLHFLFTHRPRLKRVEVTFRASTYLKPDHHYRQYPIQNFEYNWPSLRFGKETKSEFVKFEMNGHEMTKFEHFYWGIRMTNSNLII
jgi:hypothetical protein